MSTDKFLALLRSESPHFFEVAEIVGKWVWIKFAQKQPREVTGHLAEVGFHWNSQRPAWQHPCGTYRDPAGNDPRKKYHTYLAAHAQAA